MKKYNKIITEQLNRILPYHLLGIVFHTIVIYLAFKIPVWINFKMDWMNTYQNQNYLMGNYKWLHF